MNVLHDAIKRSVTQEGSAILQWGFHRDVSFPENSIQLPEDVVDQILRWRDQDLAAEGRGGEG